MIYKKWLLKLVGSKELFPWSFWLYRQAKTLAFGNLWNFKNNGELEAIDWVANQHPIRTFFDVGANTGHYFQSVLPLVKNELQEAHLFEPSPEVFAQLSSVNSSALTIRFNQLALGVEEIEEAIFFKNPNHVYSGFYSSHMSDSTEIAVKMTTLDRYTADHGIAQIDFLKIDVEGHELDVLRGAKKLLETRKIKVIQFEFGVNNISSRTYFMDFFDLLSQQFDLYLIQRGGCIPILDYSVDFEVFGKVSNFLAVQKELIQR